MSTDAELPLPRRSGKSEAAFRTISEVAEELDVPQHVLRFWEGKFPQVKPLKRGGGRRYYRPEDVQLLRKIRDLLYSDGFTIKGVQKLLREGALKDSPSQAKAEDEPVLNLGRDDEDDEVPAMDDGEESGDEIADAQAVTEDEPAREGGLAPELREELRGILRELEDLRTLLHSGER